MSEPIYDRDYWCGRLAFAVRIGQPHRAVWECSVEEWGLTAEMHRQVLADNIRTNDTVLDVGCGWGLLLDLMPSWWRGYYVGIDLHKDFVQMARYAYPDGVFLHGDVRRLALDIRRVPPLACDHFDWAIMRGMEGMLKNHGAAEDWESVLAQCRDVADKVISLNYNSHERGTVYQ